MPIDPCAIRNRLLRALPADALEALLPVLQPVVLDHRMVLHEAFARLSHVCFVQEGYVSLLVRLEEGDLAEVGMVGPEGMVGLPLAFETDHAPVEALVQSPGSGLLVEAAAFRNLMGQLPALDRLVKRYAMVFTAQIAMTAACNGRHLIEQRLARWLLMAHDRVEGNEFPMTHEFLSMMLGVRRASISVAAKRLQQGALIRYEQGRIRVTDRLGLEAVACECHGMVAREYDHLCGKIIRR